LDVGLLLDVVLTARRLNVLTAWRLHLLTARRLHLLAVRSRVGGGGHQDRGKTDCESLCPLHVAVLLLTLVGAAAVPNANRAEMLDIAARRPRSAVSWRNGRFMMEHPRSPVANRSGVSH